MDVEQHYVGQRLSLKKQLLTVRYIGSVADKPGTWLGVEWDDCRRGKHQGTHDGKRYFQCRSRSPTAASFLKPSQPWDPSRSFLVALREKYMREDAATTGETVYFSSKQAEEVGFAKFARRQAQLKGIHVVVLDQMCLRLTKVQEESEEIENICSDITDLDLARNLIEHLDEVLNLCKHLPKLRRLTLDGNRFSIDAPSSEFNRVQFLGLSNTLLASGDILDTARAFPNLTQLAAAGNELRSINFGKPEITPEKLQQIDLAGNEFTALPSIGDFSGCVRLVTINLKHNQIVHHVEDGPPEIAGVSSGLKVADLDLAYGQVASWSFIDLLPERYPDLKHLRVTGNPLYGNIRSAEGKALTADDGYMLTIARLPGLDTLNYSKITEKERLNAETYYLGQITHELSRAPADQAASIIARHPRWKSLCEEYGEPTIERAAHWNEVDPNSLAANLVTLTFSYATPPHGAARCWKEEVPKSFSIYSVLGIVGKRLGIMPLKLRLIWETGEQDPVGRSGNTEAPGWWDSDDEEIDGNAVKDELSAREIELVAGTRRLGTYIEGREAAIRVEMMGT